MLRYISKLVLATLRLCALVSLISVYAAPHAESKAPEFTTNPEIAANPNPHVPLAAIITFSATEAMETIIELSNGQDVRKIIFDENHRPRDGLPIIGMRPDSHYKVSVSIKNSVGEITRSPASLTFQTPPLPDHPYKFPPLKINVSKPDKMEPGFILANVRRIYPGRRKTPTQWQFGKDWGLLLGLDAEGEVIWYYQSDSRMAGFERTKNGNLIYLTYDFRAVEIDMLGNKIAEWYAAGRPQGKAEGAIPVDVLTMHHNIHELPSGNFITTSAKSIMVDNYYTSYTDPGAPRRPAHLMADEIIEFKRDGTIVWRWNSENYLDVYRMGYDTLNRYWDMRGFPHHYSWTHANGLLYNQIDNSLIVSFRHQDAMFKINRATGKIRWILGDHTGWSSRFEDRLFKLEGDTRWFYHAHNPSITPQGTLLLFDNGTYQALPFDKPPVPMRETFSRAVEYEINEDKLIARKIWASDVEGGKDGCISFAMGNAEALPLTGDILVSYGMCLYNKIPVPKDKLKDDLYQLDLPSSARVREFTHTKYPEVVFDLLIEDQEEILGWAIFNVIHVSDIYVK